MRQVIVIHGGEAFDTYEQYLSWLASQEVSLESTDYKGWKRSLPETLGDDYQVILIRMPSPQNAKYAEWKLWFEKYVPLLADDAIFVGHSLGGIFLAKYFAEETYSKRVKGILLVAAPFNTPGEHPVADFVLTGDLSRMWEQCGRIFLYHSTDDAVVPISNLTAYQAALPHARASIFGDRGHFNQEEFPEIVADIQSLG